VYQVLAGRDLKATAMVGKLSQRKLRALADRVPAEGLSALIEDLPDRLAPEKLARRRNGIAQILLGRSAELRFEQLIPRLVGTRGLTIEPRLADRSTTDYLLKDTHGRPLCRLNIKFHGTLFRDAQENVGLAPKDCFALATYKIHSALQQQTRDAYPYVFLILSIPNLTSASVAGYVPEDLVWLLSVVEGKRLVEEAIAETLRGPAHQKDFEAVLARMVEGEFRILSATKADRLLRTLLYERVYAIRVPRFVQATQVNMHFSLSQDMRPLEAFLTLLDSPAQVIAVTLDRGLDF
jgi:hypothetical protein